MIGSVLLRKDVKIMSHASYTPPKMVVLGDFSDVTRCLWWGIVEIFSAVDVPPSASNMTR